MRVFLTPAMGVAIVALLGTAILGCNTIKGAGKDIEKGGQAIERGASSAQGT